MTLFAFTLFPGLWVSLQATLALFERILRETWVASILGGVVGGATFFACCCVVNLAAHFTFRHARKRRKRPRGNR